MSTSALDPRRRAFAEALGRAIAEAVWRDVRPENETPPVDQDRGRHHQQGDRNGRPIVPESREPAAQSS